MHRITCYLYHFTCGSH